MDGERHGDTSVESLGVSGMNLSNDTDSSTARRILRRSFPQNASKRGMSSSGVEGLSSGEPGPRLRSSGALVQVWGGEDRTGLNVDVGLLAAEKEAVDRSKAPLLQLTGELRDSFREWMGEEVREGMETGGGEENLRQRRGDLLFRCSPLQGPWLVAKKSSRDLNHQRKIETSE